MTRKSIKQRRVSARKTVREVAVAINVTERTYARWESGDAQPDGPNLVKLADFFGCHPRDLVPAAELAAVQERR